MKTKIFVFTTGLFAMLAIAMAILLIRSNQKTEAIQDELAKTQAELTTTQSELSKFGNSFFQCERDVTVLSYDLNKSREEYSSLAERYNRVVGRYQEDINEIDTLVESLTGDGQLYDSQFLTGSEIHEKLQAFRVDYFLRPTRHH